MGRSGRGPTRGCENHERSRKLERALLAIAFNVAALREAGLGDAECHVALAAVLNADVDEADPVSSMRDLVRTLRRTLADEPQRLLLPDGEAVRDAWTWDPRTAHAVVQNGRLAARPARREDAGGVIRHLQFTPRQHTLLAHEKTPPARDASTSGAPWRLGRVRACEPGCIRLSLADTRLRRPGWLPTSRALPETEGSTTVGPSAFYRSHTERSCGHDRRSPFRSYVRALQRLRSPYKPARTSKPNPVRTQLSSWSSAITSLTTRTTIVRLIHTTPRSSQTATS